MADLERAIHDQRVYFERAITDLEKRTELALAESRRAVDKAEVSASERLTAHNAIRPELNNITAELRDRIATLEGRIYGYSAAAGLLAVVISKFLT